MKMCKSSENQEYARKYENIRIVINTKPIFLCNRKKIKKNLNIKPKIIIIPQLKQTYRIKTPKLTYKHRLFTQYNS